MPQSIRRIVISGCSGGGKSALLDELARRGHQTFPEAGRLIVKEQLASGGDGLPWTNAARFAELTLERSIEFFRAATSGVNFYDRSAIDILVWYERTGTRVPDRLAAASANLRYARGVFLAPPWPEIFATDAERRHTFDDATTEYESLITGFPARGYDARILPKVSIPERVEFIEAALP
jgi:predicted ATPase